MHISRRILPLLFVAAMASATHAGRVYWAALGTSYAVHHADRDGSNHASFPVGGSENWFAVAVDGPNEHVYWAESSPNKIRRANLDGTSAVDIIPGVDAAAIALDVFNGRLYFVSNDSSPVGIRRANLDGTGLEMLVPQTSGVELTFGLALDLRSHKMYWSEWGNRRIMRANLDGTQVEEVVPDLGTGPLFGVAVDSVNRKVYWGAGGGQLRRANLDGSGVQTVVNNPNVVTGVAVDPSEGKIYWTHGGNHVRRADLDGSDIQILANTGFSGAQHLALDTPPAVAAGIPAASGWGLAVLVLLLMVSAATVLRTRGSPPLPA